MFEITHRIHCAFTLRMLPLFISCCLCLLSVRFSSFVSVVGSYCICSMVVYDSGRQAKLRGHEPTLRPSDSSRLFTIRSHNRTQYANAKCNCAMCAPLVLAIFSITLTLRTHSFHYSYFISFSETNLNFLS